MAAKRENKLIIAFAGSVLMASLMSCATLQTVGRRTQIEELKAIHLDAQQRLVFVKPKAAETNADMRAKRYIYCAEPSPDALASYAASLGLSTISPSQNELSLAAALQSPTGSIGLRTQSITLMRDALYRICEAYNNGALNEPLVAALLQRSQDLTAVVLAVEQLTGAVAANQVILTPHSSASASANLLSQQQALDQAERDVQTKQEDVVQKKKTVEQKEEEYKQATAAASADTENAEKEAAAKRTQTELAAAREELKQAERRLEEATEVRDAIRASREVAITNTNAENRSSGQFSTLVQRRQLSDEAATAIAESVENLVTKVLEKPYTKNACLIYLSSDAYQEQKPDEKTNDVFARECVDLLPSKVANALR